MSDIGLMMLTMLFARLDDASFLTLASVCNATYYPCVEDTTSEGGSERYRISCEEFLKHIR